MASVSRMPGDQHLKNKAIRTFKNLNIRMKDAEKAKKGRAFLRKVKQEDRNAVVETKQVAKPPLPTSAKVRPTKPRITKCKSSPPPEACIKKEVHHLKATRPPAPIAKHMPKQSKPPRSPPPQAHNVKISQPKNCLLYTSPSPRDRG